MSDPIRLLFVCMGNICRSPAAEGVMRRLVEKAGLNDRIVIDSAGTEGWHAGEKADPRMLAAAARRGYELTSRARQICPTDLQSQDLILIMDETNHDALKELFPQPCREGQVRRICEFCVSRVETEVPDPYYGGPEGFEHVLDLLEDACDGLLQHLKKSRLSS